MTKQESFAISNRQIEHVSAKQHRQVGHTMISGLYHSIAVGHNEQTRSKEVVNRKYKVYNSQGQVTRDTDDMKAARRFAEASHGIVCVRGANCTYFEAMRF